MNKIFKSVLASSCLVAILLMVSCGRQQPKFQKTPVDILIKNNISIANFTIVLHDMDYEESTDEYKHQYLIMKDEDGAISRDVTPWFVVSALFFDRHKENMGMEIVSKKDGVVTKAVAPAGYSQYVGNEKYGRWTQRGGSSFWEFYGQYAFMSSLFHLAAFPISRPYYNSYRDYSRTGRTFYGPTSSGQNAYGTKGAFNQADGKKSWNNKSSSFRSKVRSRVTQSAAESRRSAFKSSRNSSRYSRSSTRGRSGGFGK